MEYSDESVCEIVKQYHLLASSLERLKDVRDDNNGAVLGYVSKHYTDACGAAKFLQGLVPSLKGRLKLRELEEELERFSNALVSL